MSRNLSEGPPNPTTSPSNIFGTKYTIREHSWNTGQMHNVLPRTEEREGFACARDSSLCCIEGLWRRGMGGWANGNQRLIPEAVVHAAPKIIVLQLLYYFVYMKM